MIIYLISFIDYANITKPAYYKQITILFFRSKLIYSIVMSNMHIICILITLSSSKVILIVRCTLFV